MAPRVSVVIPFHGPAGFLLEAVRSVRAQTFRSWELTVVEDGPSEGGERIEEALAAGGELRWFRLPHRGVSSARNRAVEASEGECIAFLDADDLWAPRKLERQVELLDRHPEVGVVYCDSEQIDERGRLLGKSHSRSLGLGRLPVGEVLEALSVRCFLVPSMAVVRRRLLVEAGGFREDLAVAEDWELFARLAARTRFGCVEEPLLLYRRHGGGAGRKCDRRFSDKLKALDLVHALLPDDHRRLSHRRKALALFHLHEASIAAARRSFGRAARSLLRAARSDPAETSRALRRLLLGS